MSVMRHENTGHMVLGRFLLRLIGVEDTLHTPENFKRPVANALAMEGDNQNTRLPH
jgi:hypothetical protein